MSLRMLGISLVVGLLVVPTVASADLGTVNCSTFESNGDQIAGWYWIREPGQGATWTFNLTDLNDDSPALRNTVFLNATALVTQASGGGSGYSAKVRLTLSSENGTTVLWLPLINLFRPIEPASTGGVGYGTDGSVMIPDWIWKGATQLTVSFSFADIRPLLPPLRPVTRHVAVRQDSLVIGFRYEHEVIIIE